MTTNYRLSDSLPKDVSGAKVLAPVNDQTSQLDFAMLRGVGAETLGGLSANVAFLGVASHKAGSAIGTQSGVMMIGSYNEAPSAIATGNAQLARVDKLGNQYFRPGSISLSYSSASTETHFTGSGLLQSAWVRFLDVNAGDILTIEDGTAYKLALVATATSQHLHETLPSMYFATSLRTKLTFSGAGTASVTIGFVQN